MSYVSDAEKLFGKYVIEGNHNKSDYFSLIKELVALRKQSEHRFWQDEIVKVYDLVLDEIVTNSGTPSDPIKFGTSGWRGILGKDVFVQSVACVTSAIVEMYKHAAQDNELLDHLGISSLKEAKQRGCVVGHDNRFGGSLLASVVAKVLSDEGFIVHYAGESTTGVLSAAVLEMKAAFSVNLTPSHNPLEYGGYKFNAADAGPAAQYVTEAITRLTQEKMDSGYSFDASRVVNVNVEAFTQVQQFEAFECWQKLVRRNHDSHGIDLDALTSRFASSDDIIVAVDSVHGASRLHMRKMFPGCGARLITLRDNADVTFGGIAPEPSSRNMQGVTEVLQARSETFKIGAIIDPDGDRIRFTDGSNEISMNQFGAMAYHYLVTYKKRKGMVAKTVATSNLANSLAAAFNEELFEPRVGFKEFKPVIGKALVFFEESDGISIIGHTPEKDAYIGLILAVDMVLNTGKNLSEYQREIESEFGAYYPDRDGIEVRVKGEELLHKLKALEEYVPGSYIQVGSDRKKITDIIAIDGRKMILEDGSWLMIRPSGTEPKVRFYVESRTKDGTADLVETARQLLSEIDVM